MVVRSTLSLFAVLASIGVAAAQDGKSLRSAIDSTFAPHAMPKISGGLEGFNIDVVDEISKRIKRPINVEGAQFAGLIPALQAGTYDFLTAVVTVTPERAEQMIFVEGFVDADFRFLTRADAPEAKTLEDFKGKNIAVQKGSSTRSSWRTRRRISAGRPSPTPPTRMRCRPCSRAAPTPPSRRPP
jgi:polar amino acid transport system substrate-binding protein